MKNQDEIQKLLLEIENLKILISILREREEGYKQIVVDLKEYIQELQQQ